MKNLDQIRAKNALELANRKDLNFGGENSGEVVKKIPTMIRENGLLATLAFAAEKGEGFKTVCEEGIIPHLKSCGIGKIKNRIHSIQDFIEFLTSQDSMILRDVTQETIAYLNYLRRFVQKG